MVYTDLTRKAMDIAYKAHHGQVDKAGSPYVFHPFHLAEQMDNEIECVCALLHDVVEDTDVTFEDLEKEFPKEVMDVLRLLTHDKDVPYMDYVNKLLDNPVAKKVKIADVLHNSDESRLAEITEKDIKRRDKYKEAKIALGIEEE